MRTTARTTVHTIATIATLSALILLPGACDVVDPDNYQLEYGSAPEYRFTIQRFTLCPMTGGKPASGFRWMRVETTDRYTDQWPTLDCSVRVEDESIIINIGDGPTMDYWKWSPPMGPYQFQSASTQIVLDVDSDERNLVFTNGDCSATFAVHVETDSIGVEFVSGAPNLISGSVEAVPCFGQDATSDPPEEFVFAVHPAQSDDCPEGSYQISVGGSELNFSPGYNIIAETQVYGSTIEVTVTDIKASTVWNGNPNLAPAKPALVMPWRSVEYSIYTSPCLDLVDGEYEVVFRHADRVATCGVMIDQDAISFAESSPTVDPVARPIGPRLIR